MGNQCDRSVSLLTANLFAPEISAADDTTGSRLVNSVGQHLSITSLDPQLLRLVHYINNYQLWHAGTTGFYYIWQFRFVICGNLNIKFYLYAGACRRHIDWRFVTSAVEKSGLYINYIRFVYETFESITVAIFFKNLNESKYQGLQILKVNFYIRIVDE